MKTEIIEEKMNWKFKIKRWCADWKIREPVFILTKHELRRALMRREIKWARFKAQYPQVFDTASEKEIMEIKNFLIDALAGVVCTQIYGLNKGLYFVDENLEIDVLVMNDKYIHNERNLKHEFFHILNSQRKFCDDLDEEVYADYFSKTGKIMEKGK